MTSAMSIDREQAITQGRAYVRLIEAADVLLASGKESGDMATLRAARRVCAERLRALVATLPPEVTAQIMAASERLAGPVGDIGKN